MTASKNPTSFSSGSVKRKLLRSDCRSCRNFLKKNLKDFRKSFKGEGRCLLLNANLHKKKIDDTNEYEICKRNCKFKNLKSLKKFFGVEP